MTAVPLRSLKKTPWSLYKRGSFSYFETKGGEHLTLGLTYI